MTAFPRTDTSIVGRWWWTVDRWTLAALALIIGFGALLTLAASPSVANRLGLDSFHFARRQFTVLPIAIIAMWCVSMMSPRGLRRLAALLFGLSIVLLLATSQWGVEIKGARRWIEAGGLSLQPSEFVKPTFAVVAAWLFAAQRMQTGIPGNAIAIALYLVVVSLLALQPDIGQTAVVSAMWFTQFFLAGLKLYWAVLLFALAIVALVAAYFLFPHVASRIDRFLDPSAGDTYQVNTSLEAFMNGGLFGRGPGEGTVKALLPDAHADFVFAVAGEEFGLIVCLATVGLFAFVVLRGLVRMLSETNLFVLLAVAGLLTQFGLQAVINMASTLNLMPPKGMTLPFLSYGGSSLVAIGLGMGMILALTRRRIGTEAM